MDLNEYKKILQEAVEKPEFQPIITPEGKVIRTHCNLALEWILKRTGVYNNELYNVNEKRLMLANEMYDWLSLNKKKVDFDNNISQYCIPSIFIAAIKEEGHGHVAVIYPKSPGVTSARWNRVVPFVANVGKKNGIIGLNWAFSTMPDIFYWGDLK